MQNKIKIAIHGFGRIGRCIARILVQNQEYKDKFSLSTIVSRADIATARHLFAYDSVHGNLVNHAQTPCIDPQLKETQISSLLPNSIYLQPQPQQPIDWQAIDAQIILDCTGQLKDRKQALALIGKDANKKIILSAPNPIADKTLVFGVNHQTLKPEHRIISNSSCTTNALCTVLKAIDDNCQIEQISMSTIHAVTASQHVIDSSDKDLRRARAAFNSIIPTKTGASTAVFHILPHLADKISGISFRVPVINVSLLDLTCRIKQPLRKEAVNDYFTQAANDKLKGVLAVSNQPLVSIDLTGHPASAIVDLNTTESWGEMIKCHSWYDNEMGFSYRMLDVSNYAANL